MAMLTAQPEDLAPIPALRATVRAAFDQIPGEEEQQILARIRLQLSR